MIPNSCWSTGRISENPWHGGTNRCVMVNPQLCMIAVGWWGVIRGNTVLFLISSAKELRAAWDALDTRACAGFSGGGEDKWGKLCVVTFWKHRSQLQGLLLTLLKHQKGILRDTLISSQFPSLLSVYLPPSLAPSFPFLPLLGG